MTDRALTPNLMDEIAALKKEIRLLKSAPRWAPQAFPVVPLGTRQDFGFESTDSTTFTDYFRGDVFLTAPRMEYDIQTWNNWESSPVTSIEWQITGTLYYVDAATPIVTAVLASGSSSAASWSSGLEQFQGTVDVTASLGSRALFRMVRFDFEAKRTGGSGQGAALRLVRPPLLRIPN